ncbi:MAG: hypothetical protein AAF411_25215 [Myxococcota bacterium]
MRRYTHLFAALIAVSSILSAAPASAQDAGAQVDSSPKGLIGLGLIGAELGLVIPAAAGLDDTWALVTFPIVGATGGAIAGHFLIDNNDQTEVGVAMLVSGLALVVPALVLTLSLTAYDPDDDEDMSEAPTLGDEEVAPEDEDGTVTEPPADVETESAARSRARQVARAGSGLLRVGEAGWMVGVPGLSLVPTYTPQELSLFGGDQSNELRLSLFSGAF